MDGVYGSGKRDQARSLTFGTTFLPRSSGLPGNLKRGMAMVRWSPFFP